MPPSRCMRCYRPDIKKRAVTYSRSCQSATDIGSSWATLSWPSVLALIDNMIDSVAFDDDLERTQALPVLTPALLLDASLGLSQVTLQRAAYAAGVPAETGECNEGDFTTEGALFEVCGSLQDSLAAVLSECRARGFDLRCGNAARRALDTACDRLDRALSAPGFSGPDVGRGSMLDTSLQPSHRNVRRESFA